MPNYTLAQKIITQPTVTENLRCPCQEDLTVTFSLLASVGVAHNGTGGVIEMVFGRQGTRQELKTSVAGSSTGIYSITIHGSTTATLDDSYEYTILYRPASGAIVAVFHGTLTIIGYATGPFVLGAVS
jgi:hypothetical protein